MELRGERTIGDVMTTTSGALAFGLLSAWMWMARPAMGGAAEAVPAFESIGLTVPYRDEGDARRSCAVRYRTLASDDAHRYNDVVGGGWNSRPKGAPHRDSDIYGDLVSHANDDAIEAEGLNINVRIWGNKTEHTFVGLALAPTIEGPCYVLRNVITAYEGVAFKLGEGDRKGHGALYLYHNTIHSPRPAHEMLDACESLSVIPAASNSRPLNSPMRQETALINKRMLFWGQQMLTAAHLPDIAVPRAAFILSASPCIARGAGLSAGFFSSHFWSSNVQVSLSAELAVPLPQLVARLGIPGCLDSGGRLAL